jgi:hypothetical protein
LQGAVVVATTVAEVVLVATEQLQAYLLLRVQHTPLPWVRVVLVVFQVEMA